MTPSWMLDPQRAFFYIFAFCPFWSFPIMTEHAIVVRTPTMIGSYVTTIIAFVLYVVTSMFIAICDTSCFVLILVIISTLGTFLIPRIIVSFYIDIVSTGFESTEEWNLTLIALIVIEMIYCKFF